jgi:hypothetical protein
LRRVDCAVVKLEVIPDPSPEESEALERALVRLLEAGPAPPRTAWWRAGLEDALSPEEGPA